MQCKASILQMGELMSPEPRETTSTGLRLQTHYRGDNTAIECAGRLTIEHAAVLKSHGKSLIPDSKRIVVDLKEVNRMDSAGLGVIVGLYVSARKANCDFLLINYNQSIRGLLGITHLLSVFETRAQSKRRFP
jgi:anti-anti-sigma factor